MRSRSDRVVPAPEIRDPSGGQGAVERLVGEQSDHLHFDSFDPLLVEPRVEPLELVQVGVEHQQPGVE